MKRIDIDVYGNVQGVFFRSTMKKKARKLNIGGYVKNMPDGSVHIEAEGPEQDLKKMVKFAREGSKLSRVDRLEKQYKEASGEFTKFRIRY